MVRFLPARLVSHDCMEWQWLEVASTQPCWCLLSKLCFFVQREKRRWSLLRVGSAETIGYRCVVLYVYT